MDAVDPLGAATRTHRGIRGLGIFALLGCAVLQLLIEPSEDNIMSVMMIVVASIVTFWITLNPRLFRAAPLPALITLGFNVSALSGALVFQTLYMNPVSFNLEVPQFTFGATAVFQAALLVALLLFVASERLNAVSRFVTTRVYQPLGLMRVPSEGQLWLMGFIGVVSLIWSSTAAYSVGIAYGDIIGKFISTMGFMAYAPFLIPLRPSMFPGQRIRQSGMGGGALIGYFFVLIGLAMVLNSRGAFVLGFASLIATLVLYYLMGQLIITPKIRRWLMLSALLLVALFPALVDMSTAIILARAERTSVSAMELVASTMEKFSDSELLETERDIAVARSDYALYEDLYVDNPFLNRLVVTKYTDNTLASPEMREGVYQEYLWNVSMDKIEALMPTPVLRFFGSELDKTELEFSMGDAIFFVESGWGLGGHRMGSSVGHGIGMLGWIGSLLIIPLFLVVFVCVQTLTHLVGGRVFAVPLLLFEVIAIATLASGDSLLTPVEFIVRRLPQHMFIYWMLFVVTAWLLRSSRPMGAVVGRPDGPREH